MQGNRGGPSRASTLSHILRQVDLRGQPT